MSGGMLTGTGSPAAPTRDRTKALALALLAVALAAFMSMMIGARAVGLHDLWSALVAFDPSDAGQIVVREIRWPKTIGGILVGSALGAAGALMQALTRNPLADPGLLGVNAGATFGVVVTIWLLGIDDPAAYVWAALAGALAISLLVWALGAVGTGVVGLLLAGAAISAFLFALVGALLLVSQAALDVYRHWILGGLDGLTTAAIAALLPVFAVGFAGALAAARRLDALALGEDIALVLGTRVWLTRALGLLAIGFLCAGAVSLAGPIGFIGLLVPHAARLVSGARIGLTILLSALLGAVLLLVADVVGRILVPGMALQAGLMVALIGGPAFAALVRRGRLVSL